MPIDLRPWRERKRQLRIIRLWLLTFIVCSLLILMAVGYRQIAIRRKKTLCIANHYLILQSKKFDVSQSFNKKKLAYQHLRASVKLAQDQRVKQYFFWKSMQLFMQDMPRSMRLVSVEIKGLQYALSGEAAHLPAVEAWLGALRRTALFRQLALVDVRQATSVTQPLLRVRIKGVLCDVG